MAYIQEQLTLHFFNALGAIGYVLPLLVVFYLLEKAYPYQKKPIMGDLFNFIYTPVFLTISLWLLQISKDFLFQFIHINSENKLISSNELSITLRSGLYLVAFDFFYYWFHRAQHTIPLLWRYHSFHHSDDNVSVLSTSRHHWLEEPLRLLPLYLPIIILFGNNPAVPFFIFALPGIYGLFIHLNTKISLKYVQKLVVTPVFHRIHHSINPNHIDKNFSILFPLWDILFNTAVFEKNEEIIHTGITSKLSPNNLQRLNLLPKI